MLTVGPLKGLGLWWWRTYFVANSDVYMF